MGQPGGKVVLRTCALSTSKLGKPQGPREFQWLWVWGGIQVAVFTSPARDRDPTLPSLLQTLSTQFRQAPEQTRDGQPWTYRLVQFADMLLNHSRNVAALTPFTPPQRQAWDR